MIFYGTEHVIAWKSKRLFRTELYLLHNDFLPEVRRFGYKIGTQFSKIPLVIDKNNYVIKIVDVYCVQNFISLGKKFN